MTEPTDYQAQAQTLTDLLGLSSPPLAISFSQEAPAGVPAYGAPMPSPAADGRTGRVPAGCVFWMKAAHETFTTEAQDHANCSVGSVTHGFESLDDAAGKDDVATLVESGWVAPESFPSIPTVTSKPRFVTYGPLAETPVAPDVVFLRVNAKQAMVLKDAWPELRFEGKPQCHIIPIAKEAGEPAASVGCMLSRVRTGMPTTEMTCALPARRLPELMQRLEAACAADKAVAEYASRDASRFHSAS